MSYRRGPDGMAKPGMVRWRAAAIDWRGPRSRPPEIFVEANGDAEAERLAVERWRAMGYEVPMVELRLSAKELR